MLSPRYLDGLSDEIAEIYSQLETDILQDMARRLSRLGKVTDATKWQAQMLAEAGGLKKNIRKILAKYDKAIVRQIEDTFTDALETSARNDNRIFKAATGRTVSAPNAQAMLSTIQKCHSDLSRLTLTTAATSESQFVREANRVYMMTQSGAFDYDTAMKSAADELSERGITTVQYENGKPVTRTIESAVRMNILTSINQTAANQTLNNAEVLGVEKFEVSAHIGARPEHEAWQGKIYTKQQLYTVCELGSVTGLCGINCRHSFYPYFEGMEEHYTQKDLDELADEKVEFSGKEMTRYEGEQKLRQIERNIRQYKRRALTQEAAGVDNTTARRKLGEWQTAARDFTNQTGIARDSAREYVGTKTGKQPRALPPAKATPAQTAGTAPTPAPAATMGKATTIESAKQELSTFSNSVYIPKDTNIVSVNAVSRELEALQKSYATHKLDDITFSGRLSARTGASANYHTLTLTKKVEQFGASVLQPKEWQAQKSAKLQRLTAKKDEITAKIASAADPMDVNWYKGRLRDINKDLNRYTEYLKYTRGNVCYKGLEVESVVAHEYGHIIADQKAGQINGYYANRNYAPRIGNPLYDKCRLIDDVYNKAKRNGDIFSISHYAADNSQEFFAETFSIFAMKQETLPQYIIDMILEVIK